MNKGGVMNEWLQLGVWILATMIFFYVPLQWYAQRIENGLERPRTVSTRLLTISVAYLVWYLPSALLLVTAWLNEYFRIKPNGWVCGISLLWTVLSFLYLELKVITHLESDTKTIVSENREGGSN